jgi:hypothetical protein
VADRIDRKGVLAGHRIVLAAVLEELHTVLVGGREGRRMNVMGGDPWEVPGEHRNHHAAAGMVSGREEDQEGRRRHKVAVDMEVALEVGTVGHSPAEDIRNSCLMFENLEST